MTAPSKKIDAFVILLLAGSLSFNVFLGWKVKRLQNIIARNANEVKVLEGMQVSSISVKDLNQNLKVITYNDKNLPTVLYIFSPNCKWCDRNEENIKMLISNRADTYCFIGLSLTDLHLKEYMDKHNLAIPIYTNPSSDAISGLGLGSTPQTIIISPQGKVLKNWLGAYNDALKAEVEGYFNLQLPGVASQLGRIDSGANTPQNCMDCEKSKE